ncbi:MAG: hypothetical protein N838_34740 [Thiohalocapsa sp. PB-PSB1]|jgi:hypothetical protein|nr:MAG: hypothetical protein N838_34740 [Thiohalocapsa sp. PB-PSB1]
MQPVSFSADVDPSLVGMEQTFFRERLLDPRLKRVQPLVRLFIEVVDATGTQGDVELIGKVFFDPLVGEQLEVGHVDRVDFDPAGILGLDLHLFREGGDDATSAFIL